MNVQASSNCLYTKEATLPDVKERAYLELIRSRFNHHFLCVLVSPFEHLHFSWRSPSSPVLSRTDSLSLRCPFHWLFFTQTLLSKAVLALSPPPTPHSLTEILYLTFKQHEATGLKPVWVIRWDLQAHYKMGSLGPLFVICLCCWMVTLMEISTFIFLFTGASSVSTYHMLGTKKLLFLTSCSGLHAALLLYRTVQYLGFSYSITGWTQSHVVTYTALGFRQLFCQVQLISYFTGMEPMSIILLAGVY